MGPVSGREGFVGGERLVCTNRPPAWAGAYGLVSPVYAPNRPGIMAVGSDHL